MICCRRILAENETVGYPRLSAPRRDLCFVDRHQIKGFISLPEKNYVGALFVDPAFQRQRIGSKLLEYVRRKRPELKLQVYCRNSGAQKFYRSRGFQSLKEQSDDSTGEKELIMCWAKGSKNMVRRHGDS